MADVIQLLPENIANQIAAGEVVQRPASVVKELLENAIDAGATEIHLAIKDAGKGLIQVVDNGCGMSETDARMCFERHATSKIRDARDLFAIRTMGFRGEAMASIGAVAQVELKTARASDELGTCIQVENSQVLKQEPCQHPTGTSIAVKNLFFSVPARRNFLKSDPVEMRHIMDEFQRVAIAHPDIAFSLINNDTELMRLQAGNLRQRLVKIFGEPVNKKLVPVKEETDSVRVSGFVGKPDYFKKSRGEQYFFVNNRFIKSSYLHHAVLGAYEGLLPADSYPLYVLFLDIEPGRIDINVHPTKQEIKFDDEKLIYNVLKVTVRHALGTHNITPTLDFDTEPAFNVAPTRISAPPPPPASESDSVRSFQRKESSSARDADNLRNWQRLYEGLESASTKEEKEPVAPEGFSIVPSEDAPTMDDASGSFSKGEKVPYQIHGQYIVSQIKSGFMLIDQQAASERILYERYLEALKNQPISTQRALFPKTISMAPADAEMLREILDEVNKLGFEITEFGENTFILQGTPAEMERSNEEQVLLERVLSQYKENLDLDTGIQENLARAMARNTALKRGQPMAPEAMRDLIDQLFACSIPYKSPRGRNCFITFDLDELQKRFGQ
jgi:DNA mismatch repair protein MutL